jgi:beta-glucosidase
MSILQGIQATCTGTVTPSLSGPASASAGYVLAFLGEKPYAETSFPGISLTSDLNSSSQNEANTTDSAVIANIAIAHAAGQKVIGVLVAGRPLDISPVIAICDAFVWACLPGTEGEGVSDVLFATGYKFSGKLPFTWPTGLAQEPINYGDGQTGLFAYGYGLSD